MIDPSSKLIFQGSLSTNYNPSTNSTTSSSTSSSLTADSPSKRNKHLQSSSHYSVLYLDGRLECYPGDPFSVGSPHEAAKPVHILLLNPHHRWSLISIPTNSNSNSFPFTLSRQPATPLNHLGLDVEAMGSSTNNRSSLNNHQDPSLKSLKDRKSLKQIFGFRPKRPPTKDMKFIDLIDPCPDLPKIQDHPNNNSNNNNNPLALPINPRSSKLNSPTSSNSPHPSIHLHQNLPNSLTFSANSESSRKQWITAFLSVFRLTSDLESNSTNNHQPLISPERTSNQQQTPIRPTISNPSFNSHHHHPFNNQQHTSRIPLAPISSQQPRSSSSTSVSTSQNFHPSPIDLLSPSSRLSPTYSPQAASSTVNNNNNNSIKQNVPESILASPSPPNNNHSLSISESSHTEMAVAVPAWIKAVRNADERKQDSDSESPQQTDSSQVLSERVILKQNSIDYYASREGSIDQVQPSSSLMSHSFSAPAPLANPSDSNNRTLPGIKPAMSTSIKSFGSSVVQNLKRAGSLTDWPDYSSPGQSILQRMRESDQQSTMSESPRPSSPGGQVDQSEAAHQKRIWLLNVVKKKNSIDNKLSTNSPLNPSPMPTYSPSSTSALAPRSTSRTARYGIYMLKGLSSNSSLSSSSHHFPGSSSRESDSLHQVLSQATDSEQGDHQISLSSTDQTTTLPQLPQPFSVHHPHSHHPPPSSKRPQTGQTKKAFSDWLSNTSSQAALRLRQSSTDFGSPSTHHPHHNKSRSVTSATRCWPPSTTTTSHKLPTKYTSDVGLSILNHSNPTIRHSSESFEYPDKHSLEDPPELLVPRSSASYSIGDRSVSPNPPTHSSEHPSNPRHHHNSHTTTPNNNNNPLSDLLPHPPSSSTPPSLSVQTPNRPRTLTVIGPSDPSKLNKFLLHSLPVPPPPRRLNKNISNRPKQHAVLGSDSIQELVLSGLSSGSHLNGNAPTSAAGSSRNIHSDSIRPKTASASIDKASSGSSFGAAGKTVTSALEGEFGSHPHYPDQHGLSKSSANHLSHPITQSNDYQYQQHPHFTHLDHQIKNLKNFSLNPSPINQ